VHAVADDDVIEFASEQRRQRKHFDCAPERGAHRHALVFQDAFEKARERRELDVVNRGPLLPEAMRHQLFDSLVSVRDSDGERPHLGLGLYIVMLIAEFHGGRAEAANLADGSGVCMSVSLPGGDAGAA
jgi:K+-sensing histidine kinase KdpD